MVKLNIIIFFIFLEKLNETLFQLEKYESSKNNIENSLKYNQKYLNDQENIFLNLENIYNKEMEDLIEINKLIIILENNKKNNLADQTT